MFSSKDNIAGTIVISQSHEDDSENGFGRRPIPHNGSIYPGA